MGIRARILKVVEEGGPRKRTVLEGLCRTERQQRAFPEVMRGMLDRGELKMFGKRRGATYGKPLKR